MLPFHRIDAQYCLLLELSFIPFLFQSSKAVVFNQWFYLGVPQIFLRCAVDSAAFF